MPQIARVWKRKQDGWFYATINGRQEKLSPDYQEARDLFHKLKSNLAKKKTSGKLSTTLKEVCDAFLTHTKQTKAEKTYENRYRYLQSFCDFVGKGSRVHDLKGGQLDAWSLSQGWNSSTQAAARASVMTCLNWGVKRRLIMESPFWGMERGTFKRKDRILKKEEREKIRGVVKGGLADFLQFISMTGCRPFSEAAKVTAAMIDWKDESITFEKHKMEGKGRRRTIYLPPALLQRLKELAVEYPEGPLLRTRTGRPWSRPAASKGLRRIEAKTGINRLTVYAFRHAYITDCLAKGMSPTIIGRLVGNSARTISRFYEHVDQKKDELREAARKAIE
jgi:integrase